MSDPRRARRAVAAMFPAAGFVMGARALQIPLLWPRHGNGAAVPGLVILVPGLGALGAMPFAGRLISRFGTRSVLAALALALVPVLPLVVAGATLWLPAPAMALMGAVVGCMDGGLHGRCAERPGGDGGPAGVSSWPNWAPCRRRWRRPP